MSRNERLVAIKKMYNHEAIEEDVIMLEDGEIIDNWYILGFQRIEDLETNFNIEDLYDLDLDAKLYIKDIHC